MEIFNNEYVALIYESVIYLASTFFLFFLGKKAYQLIHPKYNVQDELVEKDNFAFAVAHTGYFIGLLLAIGSAIYSPFTIQFSEVYKLLAQSRDIADATLLISAAEPTSNLLINVIDIFIYGIVAIILLNLSIIINDKFILSKFSVYDEIVRDQNTGTGVVEAASAIGTGLIIFGSISGEGGSLITALAFWVIGQLILLLTAWAYNKSLPFDIHEHIEKDNVAVGIGFAGAIIAIANLVRFGLMSDFDIQIYETGVLKYFIIPGAYSWFVVIATVFVDVIIGLVFLPIVRFLADKILLPGQKLTDELINQEKPNCGAALIEAFAYIGGSVLITWCI